MGGFLSFGLAAPRIALFLAGAHLALLALCAYRKRLDVFRPRGPALAWVALLGAVATVAAVALLPVLRTGGFSIGNDTFTYCAFSDWLQTHGFGTSAEWDPASPVTSIPWLWQQQRYPLGAAHFIALVQAIVRAPTSLLVYPAVSATGMVLQALALFVVARWVLRLSSAWSAASCLFFAVMPHPSYWGHHNGFLQQTCALAVLLLAIAVFARGVSERHWRLDTAVFIALLTAYLLNVYLPLVVPLVAAAAAWGAASFFRARRKHRERRFLAQAGVALLLVVVFSFADLRGVLGRFLGFARSETGGHVAFSAVQFLEFAMGLRVLGPHGTSVDLPFLGGLPGLLTPLALGLAVVGLYETWRRPRTRGVAAVLSLLAVAIGYYALLVRDPWSGRVGHTWNVFKLMQWAFPLVFLLQVAALQRLPPARTPGRRLALAAVLLAPLSLLGVHWAWGEALGRDMQDVFRTERPLAELPALKRRFQELPPGTLLVVGRPVSAHRWLGPYTALLAYPRPIVGDWTYSPSIGIHPRGGAELYADLVRRIGEDGVVPILAGFVPFQPGGFESLGGGFARLVPASTPLVVHVVNPGGVTVGAGRPEFTMKEGRTKLVVYSPVDLAAELRLRVRPYAPPQEGQAVLRVFLAPDDFDHRAVRSAVEGDPVVEIPVDGRTDFAARVSLPRGLSTVVLRPPGVTPLVVEDVQLGRPGSP